ncbi:hypothetical protein NEUTE1DRAFT_111166 [Neurospora tetrasperma FGSC 2508]|uniref:Uncharacterized protein n=1 Tax=Neurospora tetrasperma (strain FGSC 2508 / ATCC MYA-4615 / P0657) TaxID=510951 RepID=F8MQU1_NEUT8|nr:uncharacterized protein NEUTE1DRAFT_111166 [Neurospora tetrasperma FGSC 2508]EGO56721.1 hypothetical protein NEUTE1DRAFT_111166 [Neurospora tetrasperma FGSC 2508]EGZ70404.1 hypothetical protein NEUTE2DRAFT_139884 [Neurospora tetrasperma FGSC 2509]
MTSILVPTLVEEPALTDYGQITKTDKDTMKTPTPVMALMAGESVMELLAEDSVKELVAKASVMTLTVEDSGMDFDKAYVRDLGSEDSGLDSDEDSGILMSEDFDNLVLEDSDNNPTTGKSNIDIHKRSLVVIPAGYFIIASNGEIMDLITHPEMLLDDVFQYFPDYEPRFKGEAHLNPLHRFVCEDTCFLRNWLFVQDLLFMRFWDQFGRTRHASSLNKDTVGALGEIISFFVFATMPFDTRRLPNNNWIGNYGRLLRPDSDTFLRVWEFYDGPLRCEIGDALVGQTISNIVKHFVAKVSLDYESQPAGNPERINATVCFNPGDNVHLREVQRSWMNFRNNVDKRLAQLGPSSECCGNKEVKVPTVFPKEYFPTGENIPVGNNIIEPPRIRRYYWNNETAPPLVNHDWWDTAAHHYNFVTDAHERSRPAREEPEPPRESSYGNKML